MSKKLFEDSNSDDEKNENTNEFKTNEEYAKIYNKFRQKELLQKLKDRGLDNSDDETESTSSDSSLSDDDVYDPKFDEEFYKTLSSIKSKDPSIYDKNAKFFENYDGFKKDDNKNENHREKALTLKDYERKIILEKGGVYEDDEDEIDEVNERATSPSYVQEEEKLKKEFKKILNSDDDEENEEFGGIFKKRIKTKEEEVKEEEDFIKWLAGKKQDIDKSKKEKLNPLKQYWNNPNLPKEEQFLRDYVLNNGYTKSSSKDIPTYEEIINDIENLSEDEKELERQSEFEHKFNYRFEEPDKEFIKRYPRTIENSVRKIDDKRKLKRLETKERKQKEKEEKFKELELLKELKRKEIEEKIEKLKEVTGNEELPFNDIDLDEDFDPDAHDKHMKQLFNDDYYKVDEGEEKPECPDIDELKIEDWDNYDPKQDNDDDDDYDYSNENEAHCEDDDFIMDCDYEKNKEKLQNELIENSKSKRKRKRRRNRFMEIIKQDKPVFNPEDEKTYAEYIDEYYKMDCEDIIDDTPCRFKYVETVPNDFGLTIEEILLAKNKELNQWASLKKAVQIRPDHVERNEAKLYKLKAQNLKLKKKIFRSLYGSSSSDEEEEKEENSEKSPVKKDNNSKKEVEIDNTVAKKIKKSSDVQKSTNVIESNVENDKKTDNETITDLSNQLQKKKKKNKPIDKGNNEKQSLFKNNKNTNRNVDNPFKNKNADNSFKNKRKRYDKSNSSNKAGSISDERLKAYGLNPKKFHKKQKFLNKNNKS